ncbi:MAG TPA: alcohol dehydrogenase catalytic domain-containing protein [Candidatus Binataceae bacterium]|nr:alcohol dehydrogenase catalytic domain-containing protein [Candidatus Binataceae bacterium]
MKAVVCKAQNRLAVEDVPKPQAGAGQVLLKVRACGICGSDLHALEYGFAETGGVGTRFALSSVGNIMGHEFCGEIAEVGAGVDAFKPGDRVTSLPFLNCGECAACRAGKVLECRVFRVIGSAETPGAYAEYVRCGAGNLLKLPAQVNFRQGALVEPLSVALGGVNRGRLAAETPCLVMGAGPIGLGVLMWLKAKGIKTIVVSEPSASRAALAQQVGPSMVVNPRKQNPAETVAQLAGSPPSVVYECVGAKGTLAQATEFAAPGGQVVVIGYCMVPDEINPHECINKSLTLDFSAGYTRADFETTIDALATGRIKAEPMITDVVSLDEVPAMFERLHQPNGPAKVMIEM